MKGSRFKFFFSILLSILLAAGLFTGCGNVGGKQTVGDTDEVAKENDSENEPQNEKENEDNSDNSSSEPVAIRYWAATSPESADVDPENVEVYKLVEEKTNVDIQWIHIPINTEEEQFKLMVASNELPDVIFYRWGNYGPDKAMADEIIVPIDDIITKYAPNLSKFLNENSEIARDMKTDSGHYYVFPYIKGLELADRIDSNGLQMRKDWLESLGFEAPKTIDDWYNTLKAFRDQKGAKMPFAISLDRLGFITSAWGFNMTKFGIDDGKLIYPPIEPKFKEVLETFRKWTNEGLLVFDPEELNDFTKKIVSGTIGAWQHSPRVYVEEGRAINPNFDVVAVQNPVLTKGDTPIIFPRYSFEGRGAAVSAQCPEEKYEAIGRWLDFSYSDEGYILDNFGIEGEHYTIVDDKIMPTDIMYDAQPYGLTQKQYRQRHFRPRNAPGPYMTGNRNYLHQDALNKDVIYPYRVQAVKAWGNGDPSKTLPLLYLTAEETDKVNNYSEMHTYVDEMIIKFINGEESLDNFDKFVEEAKRLGANEIVTIYQAALDRYYAR